MKVLPFFLLLSLTEAANILVWASRIGHSHVSFLGSLADELHLQGHNVTILHIENDPDVTTLGFQHVQNFKLYGSQHLDGQQFSGMSFKTNGVFNVKTVDVFDFFKLQLANHRICDGMLRDEKFLSELKSAKFDLVLLEIFNFCPAGVIELLGIPKIISVSALGLNEIHHSVFDLNLPLSHVPTQLTALGSKMGVVDRLFNIYFHYLSKICVNFMLFQDQFSFWRHVGMDFKWLDRIYNEKIEFTFSNTNEFTESTRPTMHNIRMIGGSTIPKPQPLNRDFTNILMEKPAGTIVFSLGSLIKPGFMPETMKKAFLDAFSEFPEYNFIMKSNEMTNFTYPNIYPRRWIPQVDLLADGRVKAFITHCGMNSLTESLYFGVPIIALPIFADQDSNAIVAEERGLAFRLSKFTVNKEKIVEAIRTVLMEGSTHKEKVQVASKVMKLKKKSMLREFLEAVEISVLTPPQHHLKFSTHHLSTLEYYNLDCYFVIFVLFYSLHLSFFTLRRVFCSIFARKIKTQ